MAVPPAAPSAGSGPARALAGWLLGAAGLGFNLWRGTLAVHWLRAWRQNRVFDPSAAELYQVNFWFEVAFVALAAAVTALAVWLLRPRPPVAPDR